ncbi:oligosaccharide flippase family protein [Rhodobacteraceae bacterium R_SAG10]|nr:oligosaccharide flippase family protein [Rhodobacteraceae bacterium R_SAG10]
MIFKREEQFFLRVITLGVAPRILTVGLTTVSLALMLRSVGLKEYGVFVFINSISGFFSLAIDFGIAATAGRAIATARAEKPETVLLEVRNWLISRVFVSSVLTIPVLLLFFALVKFGIMDEVETKTILLVVLSVLLGPIVDVQRRIMTSLLAFGQVAIRDTIQSLLRSLGWFTVAFFLPSAFGLFLAASILSLLSVLIGIFQIKQVLKAYPDDTIPWRVSFSELPIFSRRQIRTMLGYLGLTSGGRFFKDAPPVLIKLALGYEAAGLLGSAQKIVELAGVPFSIIGNGLKVRAREITIMGTGASPKLLDKMFRISVLAGVVSICFWFLSEYIGKLLLPDQQRSALVFSIFAPALLFRAWSDLFAPTSDYVGALSGRIRLLWVCSILQIPIIWFFSAKFGDFGGMASIVACLGVLCLGYVTICVRVLSNGQSYRMASDILLAGGAVLISAVVAFLSVENEFARLAVFLGVFLVAVFSLPSLRQNFGNGSVLKYDF